MMTHPTRHECNAWCRDDRHVNLNYSTSADDAVADDLRRWYARYGLDVLDVRPATEAPPVRDDPAVTSWWVALESEGPATDLSDFQHAYLVTFKEADHGR